MLAFEKAGPQGLHPVLFRAQVKAYKDARDVDNKATVFAIAMSSRLLLQLGFADEYGKSAKGPRVGFWRSLGIALAGSVVPSKLGVADLIAAQAARASGGGRDLRDFDEERADARAQMGRLAAQRMVAEYVGPAEGASFLSDSPIVQTRRTLQAMMVRETTMTFPSLGILVLTDSPKPEGMDLGSPGSSAKEHIVGRFLGTDSPEYRAWDHDRSPRKRGEVVKRALASLFELGLQVVSDPSEPGGRPPLAPEVFKERVRYPDWVFGDVRPERAVGEAFGKVVLRRFQSLAKQYQDSKDGVGMNPELLKEYRDTYRAATVSVVTFWWAFYLEA
jgi:hypothetical protein